MIGNTNENHEYLAISLTSGELQAQEMLKSGSPEQKLLARRYLDCLENVRSFYSKPLEIEKLSSTPNPQWPKRKQLK